MFDDADFVTQGSSDSGIPCVCPPSPLPFLNRYLDQIMYILTGEWVIRVLFFVPADPGRTFMVRVRQWFQYFTDASTLVDALAIFPYYLELLPNGFVSLRLLRLFRLFQLVRLVQYNKTFGSLKNVLKKSIIYLKVLLLVLAFGAAFFGSILYWLEKGIWKYHDASGDYRFVRIGIDGFSEEPTPFTSIPAGFWWFMVTATTVGYGGRYTYSNFCGVHVVND
jgi:hypothetical protein